MLEFMYPAHRSGLINCICNLLTALYSGDTEICNVAGLRQIRHSFCQQLAYGKIMSKPTLTIV